MCKKQNKKKNMLDCHITANRSSANPYLRQIIYEIDFSEWGSGAVPLDASWITFQWALRPSGGLKAV